MYYIVTESGVKSAPNLKGFRNVSVVQEDFKAVGKDFVAQLTADDLTYMQDRKALSAIPMRNLYKPNNTVMIMILVNMLLTFIVMVKG